MGSLRPFRRVSAGLLLAPVAVLSFAVGVVVRGRWDGLTALTAALVLVTAVYAALTYCLVFEASRQREEAEFRYRATFAERVARALREPRLYRGVTQVLRNPDVDQVLETLLIDGRMVGDAELVERVRACELAIRAARDAADLGGNGAFAQELLQMVLDRTRDSLTAYINQDDVPLWEDLPGADEMENWFKRSSREGRRITLAHDASA